VAKPENDSGIGMSMGFRDRLLDQRMQDIRAGKAGGRMDSLQA